MASRAPTGTSSVFLIPLRAAVYWAPVWIPLGLFAQIAWLGLRPALDERDRLEREASAVETRHERDRAEWERMRDEREAWNDEVWRERWRRARLRETDGTQQPEDR